MTTDPTAATGRTELRQSTGNALQFPIFIAVVVLAVFVRQFFGAPPSPTVIVICAVAFALDLLFVRYCLRHMGTLVVTPTVITFTHDRGSDRADQVIRRVDGSVLGFRVARNGPMGSQYTGYTLKLRDNATGDEIYAGSFGRQKIRGACQAQGWTFDKES